MSLPGGTITLLFTDVEGSTELWENHPRAMAPALARHDALIREAATACNGAVFKTVGDAFCVAFSTAQDALNAALNAQRALASETWPEGITVRVRMALHTGACEQRDNDYFGPLLNRVARLLTIGHGGQVLLSNVTYELVRDSLPPQAELVEMGLHRLKDLQRPELVFQLRHPALPDHFPPLRSLDNPALPNNLQEQMTSFVGRESELAEVKSLMTRTRLLTLLGSGGCGKTRLALQAAADLLGSGGSGVWCVELAPLANPDQVAQEVLTAIGATEQSGKTVFQTLAEFLHSRRVLLVLDNCEHLLAACAHLAATLLRQCPHVSILATSRENLGIAGEQTYRVPPLSLPDLQKSPDPQTLSQYEAVRLFVERAVAVNSSFAVTNANAPALAQLCVHLGGIPLAIELAAARVRALTVEEINERLKTSFRLLAGGDRTALPRHQTLQNLINWSYNLLNEQEKALFDSLSVFAGGWTLAAAEAVCANDDLEEWEVLDVLASLVDKSLAIAEQEGSETRYHFLETILQFARERLHESGNLDLLRQRHQRFYLAFAKRAVEEISGAEATNWLNRIEAEHNNLRAAMDYGPNRAGAEIAATLWNFWYVRGYLQEGRTRLAQALSILTTPEDTLIRANALNGAGVLTMTLGEVEAAQRLLEEGLSLFQTAGDRSGTTLALNNLGILANTIGSLEKAKEYFLQSLEISRELRDTWSVALVLNNLGVIPTANEYAENRERLTESLTLFRELGNQWGIALALGNLAKVVHQQGDVELAWQLQIESCQTRRKLSDKRGLAYSLLNLMALSVAKQDYAAAKEWGGEGLQLNREIGSKPGIALALERFAELAVAQGQMERAVRLWGVAAALREATRVPLAPGERATLEAALASARSLLGEAAFERAWAAGQALTPEDAAEYALQTGSGA